MCLAKAYLSKNGGRELVAEEVTLMEIKEGKLLLWTLFGEQREIQGNIKEVNFQNSSIILEQSS